MLGGSLSNVSALPLCLCLVMGDRRKCASGMDGSCGWRICYVARHGHTCSYKSLKLPPNVWIEIESEALNRLNTRYTPSTVEAQSVDDAGYGGGVGGTVKRKLYFVAFTYHWACESIGWCVRWLGCSASGSGGRATAEQALNDDQCQTNRKLWNLCHGN